MSDTIEYNFLSGSTLYFNNSLFFDLFKENEVYLGFARPEPIWGFSSLIKILPDSSKAWPTDFLATDDESTNDTKYFDKKRFDVLTDISEDPSLLKIQIGYISKNDDPTVVEKYTFLNLDEIGEISLDYLNVNWMRVRGLDQFFLKELIDLLGIDDYDYYVFNYEGNINSRIKIATVEQINQPSMKFPVKLMYNTDGSSTPSTALDDNIVGSLTKSVNIYGESYIYGLNESFLDYIIDKSLTGATFFITRADGTILQDKMTYIQKYEDEKDKYLLFSYEQIQEAIAKSGRLKISTSKDADQLAIFTEQFSDGTFVSDKTPPPLTLNYLKSNSIQDSVMDLVGLVKIQPEDVTFSRRIDNQDTNDAVRDIPGMNVQNIIPISIKNNEESEVWFAYTDDQKIARENFFDLIRIDMTVPNNALDNTFPSELDVVYRQLLVVYKPKDKNGNTCTNDTYTASELFDDVEHQFNLGTIVYMANKTPVLRQFLEVEESFTLII